MLRSLAGPLALTLVACASPSPATHRRSTSDVALRPTSVTPPVERDRTRPLRLVAHGGFCRIDPTGAVWWWGPPESDELAPRRIEGIDDAVELASTPLLSCVRRASGRVTCFAHPNHAAPEPADAEIDDAVDLAAQHHQFCAVRRTGRVACWGGPYGLVDWRGDAPTWEEGDDAWHRITEREGITDAVALRAVYFDLHDPAGGGHGGWCVLRRSGQVTCWGHVAVPGEPELSADPSSFELVPLDDVVDMASTGPRTCVLRRSGAVLCTTAPAAWDVSNAATERCAASPSVPAGWCEAPGARDIVELEWRGLGPGTDCGRTEAGELRCWDETSYRDWIEWGTVEPSDPRLLDAPEAQWAEQARWGRMPASLLGRVDEVRANDSGGCASLMGGGVECWGDAADGHEDHAMTAQRVEGLSDIVAVRAGDSTSCARSRDGRVLCWGDITAAVGADSQTLAEDPVHVPELDGAQEVVLARRSICARLANGEVRCRGSITTTDLGVTEGVRAIGALRGTRALALSGSTLCGLRDGRVRCYQAEHGTELRRDGLVTRHFEVAGVTDATELHASHGQWYVRSAGGRVGWYSTEVARPAIEWLDTPLTGLMASVGGLPCAAHAGTFACLSMPRLRQTAAPPATVGDLTRIAAGDGRLCGVRADEQVTCWPAENLELVLGLSGALDVTVGAEHACAVTRAGEVHCWGRSPGDGRSRPLAPRARIRRVPELR